MAQDRKNLPAELLAQLNGLLEMRKAPDRAELSTGHATMEELIVLEQHLEVKTLILRVLGFRAKLQQDGASNRSGKSAEGKIKSF